MYKRLSLIFVCLLLLSTLVTALHHHDDAGDHHDCPVCVVGLHQPASTAGPFVFTIIQTFHLNTYLTPAITAPATSLYATANNRAPPA